MDVAIITCMENTILDSTESYSYFCISPWHRLFKSSLYYAGDVFYVNWDEVLVGATAVVSTLGGFGSEEQMKRINGEANVLAVGAAKDYGMPIGF